ncbi:MAG: hypothetical protein WCJ03_00110 [Bacteroidales bacterium]
MNLISNKSVLTILLLMILSTNTFEAPLHPRLFFNQIDLINMRERANNAVGNEMLNLLKTQYETECITLDTTTTGNKSRLAAIAGFLYLMTQNEQYAIQSYEFTLKTITDNNEPWAAISLKGLTSYWSAYCISFAYDWCYNSPNWSTTQKSYVSTKLKSMADMIATNGGTEQNTMAASNWQGIRGASAILAYLSGDVAYSETNYSTMKYKLNQYVLQNFGDSVHSSGWNIEGLGYEYYPVGNFIGPAGIALERFNKQDGLRKYPSFVNSFWTIYSTLSTGIDLLGFGGLRPDFGDDNPHVSGEGVFGQSFYYLPPEMKPAAKYWYDKAVGNGRQTMKYDGYRLGLIWSYLYYPFEIISENPANADSWKTLMQDYSGGNGYYTYRNQFKDGSDEIAQMYVKQRGDKGHAGPDALSFRILGTNSAWAIGGGRYGKIVAPMNQEVYWHLMNTVYPIEPLVGKIGSVGCITCTTNTNSGTVVGVPYQNEDGSGHIISEMAANNVWTIGHKRWFVADYDSLNTGCRAFYLIADSTVNGKYWQMVTAVENTVTNDANSFTVTSPNGSSMKGTVFMAGAISIKTGTSVRGSTYGLAADSKYITILGTTNKFLVTLSVVDAGNTHPIPAIVAASNISNTKINLSNKSYLFKKDNILYNNTLPLFWPQAVWSISRFAGVAPLQVTFDAAKSYSPSNKTINLEINSGNTALSLNKTLAHTYTEPGTYLASVKITDSDNKVATRFAYILVGGSGSTQTVNELQSQLFRWSFIDGILQLTFDGNSGQGTITCYDVRGQVLVSKEIDDIHQIIDLRPYPRGLKIIKVVYKNSIRTFKIIN